MTLFAAFSALRTPTVFDDPISALVPGVVYDAVLAAVIGPLLVSIHDRRTEPDRVDW